MSEWNEKIPRLEIMLLQEKLPNRWKKISYFSFERFFRLLRDIARAHPCPLAPTRSLRMRHLFPSFCFQPRPRPLPAPRLHVFVAMLCLSSTLQLLLLTWVMCLEMSVEKCWFSLKNSIEIQNKYESSVLLIESSLVQRSSYKVRTWKMSIFHFSPDGPLGRMRVSKCESPSNLRFFFVQ